VLYNSAPPAAHTIIPVIASPEGDDFRCNPGCMGGQRFCESKIAPPVFRRGIAEGNSPGLLLAAADTPRGRARDCSGNPFCSPVANKKIGAESPVFAKQKCAQIPL
jgi:hypothetical protein